MARIQFAAVLLATAALGACGSSQTSSPERNNRAPDLSAERMPSKPASPKPLAPAPASDPAILYGKSDTIEGIWFTNFENSRFLECSGKSCDDQPISEWASIACLDRFCEMLDREAY